MSATQPTRRSPQRLGIEQRTTRAGQTQYRGTAYDKAAGRHVRGPWKGDLASARSWRVDALAQLQRGTLTADRGLAVAAAVDTFIAGIQSGDIRNRSGDVFKPSAVRGYTRDLRDRFVPAFGAAHLRDITLPDLQRWADRLAVEGLAPNTVRNVITAARALFAWAVPRALAAVNPTAGLRLPSGETKRDRIAAADEAQALVAALEPRDRAALGLALYSGLRVGEIVALDWTGVDLDARTLRVERGWDPTAREFITPKSKAGRRTVPIMDRLAVLLADHAVLQDYPVEGLLFPGRDRDRPTDTRALSKRMERRWRAAGLTPIGMHEARHAAASTFIAAGLNAKTVSTYLGHASIGITFDRYGHLFPGNENEARGLLDAFMARHAS